MTSSRPAATPPVTDNWRITMAVLLMALVLLLPTLSFRIAVDQAVFAHIGAELLEGRWPYLATWEADYPGMMFLHAAEILVFGKSIAMFRLFDLLFQLGIVFCIYRITFRVGSRAGGILAAGVYCLIYQGYGTWNTAQREGFATFFVLAGFWLYLTAARRAPWKTAAGIGLGLGAAVLIKPTMLALGWFYLPLLPLLSAKNVKWPAIGVAGLLLPATLVIALYAALGGLRELYEATVAYQPIYAARLRGDEPLLVHWYHNTRQLGRQTVAVGLAYLPFLATGPMRRERLMLYFAYLGAVASVVVQGTFAGYHYLPGLAVGAILIGSGFTIAVTWIAERWTGLLRSHRPAWLAALLVALAAPFCWHADSWLKVARLQFLQPPTPQEYVNGTVFNFSESYNVARYLKAHTDSADRIQVWGYEPLVYYLSDRDEASRFHVTHPLVMRVPGQPISQMQVRWRAEFMQDVSLKKPKYVAVVQDDNWWWAPGEQTSEELLDDFPEWQTFIRSNYELEETIGRFLVYRWTRGPEAP